MQQQQLEPMVRDLIKRTIELESKVERLEKASAEHARQPQTQAASGTQVARDAQGVEARPAASKAAA